jgi:hypothetical protein
MVATVLTTATATTTSAAQSPPVITAVSVSPGTVQPTGLETTPVTVSVSLTDNAHGDPTSVYLYRTAATKWDRSAPSVLTGALHRTSGTATAGTHQAVISVPSSADGPWRVAAVEFGLNGSVIDPRDSGVADATLAVTGTHRPRMRFAISPRPLPYPRHDVSVKVQLTYDDTREPIASHWVFFGADSACGEYGPNSGIRTNAQGFAVWRVTVPGPEALCASMDLPRPRPGVSLGEYAGYGASAVVGTALTAVPSRTLVHQRTKTAVNGRALAIGSPFAHSSPYARVVLQRLVGRHWRNVSEAKVRSSGRFTLYASPPLGRNHYRAAFPTQFSLGASTTRPFVIRGTS